MAPSDSRPSCPSSSPVTSPVALSANGLTAPRGGIVHHIVFQSEGGKSELANEVAVCATCHALIHAGLLRVSGNANGDLRWLPIAAGDSLGSTVGSAGTDADRLPVRQVVADPADRKRPADGTSESAIADSEAGAAPGNGRNVADCGLNLDALSHGLIRLGVPAARSRRIIGAVVAGLPRAEITEANVLRKALASI